MCFKLQQQKESGKAGFGFVARNYNGQVLVSGARSEVYANSPLEAEAKSLMWATIRDKEVTTTSFSNLIPYA